MQGEEVDRGRPWRDCEGGRCVSPVRADIAVPVGAGMVDNGGVGLVYENNVHGT